MVNRMRNRYVSFRLTEDEWNAFDAKVASTGITKGRYLRNLVNSIAPRQLPPEELKEALKQLRHIGNNINQMAIVANKTGHLDTMLYKENYERLQQQISKLMMMLMEPSYVVEDICR